MESTPENLKPKKRKRTSTSGAAKVIVVPLEPPTFCSLYGENQEHVEAIVTTIVDQDGEVAYQGEATVCPQQTPVEPDQQLPDDNTYVMGGVICGKTYMVIMKFRKSWH